VPITLRLTAGSVLLLAGLALLAVGVLGSRSRLRRNAWFGIRTRATMRSDAAFITANRAGAVPAGAAGAVAVAGGAVLLAGADGALDWVVLVVSVIGTLVLAGVAGMVGDRAAAVFVPPPAAACAGSCAGCDLVAGCRPALDRASEPSAAE
jgi:hypothetical protein